MKKLVILLACLCGGITGCADKQQPTKSYVIYPTPESPFDVSLNRELYYQKKNTINTSLFGLKQTFTSPNADFNPAKKASPSPVVDGIISRGYSLMGKPYRYGGESGAGFDCSGFVGYLYRKEAGIDLPRSTRQMIKVDAPKVAKNKLKPGDVLFFSTGRGRQVGHTAIYIGNDYFIHAANQRKGVRIDSLNNSYWGANFLEAKRLLN